MTDNGDRLLTSQDKPVKSCHNNIEIFSTLTTAYTSEWRRLSKFNTQTTKRSSACEFRAQRRTVIGARTTMIMRPTTLNARWSTVTFRFSAYRQPSRRPICYLYTDWSTSKSRRQRNSVQRMHCMNVESASTELIEAIASVWLRSRCKSAIAKYSIWRNRWAAGKRRSPRCWRSRHIDGLSLVCCGVQIN